MNDITERELFRTWFPADPPLERACQVAVERSLAVKPGERVLIVTNPETEVSAISLCLYDACFAAGAAPSLLFQPVKGQLDFADPGVIAAIAAEPDVIISLSAERMGKDQAAQRSPIAHEGREWDHVFHYVMHGKKTARSFWSPRATREMFRRTVPIDYDRLKRECRAAGELLSAAVTAHIVSPAGCDLRIGLRGRKAFLDDGDFSKPGSGGNLPAGEAFISPEIGTAEGSLVFDGSISGHDGEILIREPIRCDLRDGFITRISGGAEAAELERTIASGEENAMIQEREGKLRKGLGEVYARNSRGLGELGIGLNPLARIAGVMLEDEKAYRTCHIAIGKNYDEDANSLIHLDGLITEPTITLTMADGSERVLLDGGELRV